MLAGAELIGAGYATVVLAGAEAGIGFSLVCSHSCTLQTLLMLMMNLIHKSSK